MPKEDLKLFGVWSSPFYHRVVWALRTKEIEYEYFEEDLANKSPLLLQYNPIHQKVPVLVHNGKPIIESVFILQYIDETWKDNTIFPQDPHEKANAHFWAKFGDDKLLSSIWRTFITEGKDKEEAMTVALENLKVVEELLKGKKYFGGEKIGFLDFCLGWICKLVGILDEIDGLNKTIDDEQFPLLSTWIENFSSSLYIKDTWPPNDRWATRLCYVREIVRSSSTS
ncbi:hypothetical protein AQUCO_02000239v1 [Aquilegia coerulea]|uniref:glutathione transferase n=1 Tax=Aquilegia coerulea TaxID=218851 RepID=A0A2G5DGN3_AQUCA|nr:hypothetical protein AQUCO_02000239v1 [Aquilegia coerulea]